MLDLAIVGATVVTPTGPALLDIGVRGGVTAMLVTPGSLPEAVSTLDAAGKIVLPAASTPTSTRTRPTGWLVCWAATSSRRPRCTAA